MSLEDELTNAITMFRDKLDSRPMAKSENIVHVGIQERGASFSCQLPIVATNETTSGTAVNDGQQTPPVIPKPVICFGGPDITVSVAGITACPPGTGVPPAPSGDFTLNYFGFSGGLCTWFVDDGTYAVVVNFDTTTSLWTQASITTSPGASPHYSFFSNATGAIGPSVVLVNELTCATFAFSGGTISFTSP